MKFLHVGCGPKTKTSTTRGFNSPDWEEIRFDIDEKVSPDIIGTMTDMSSVSLVVLMPFILLTISSIFIHMRLASHYKNFIEC